MKTYVLLLAALSIALFSCKKDNLELTGEPSLIGAVGNELTFSNSVPGIGTIQALVTEINGGVSTVEASFTVDNTDLLPIFQAVADLYPAEASVVGNTVTASVKARFTTDGIAAVANNGEELVVCKYDASVGDEWTANYDGNNVKHKVTQKSSDDDFPFGFYYIKVVTMEGTGYDLPGLTNVKYISNHRFGPVGFQALMSDGTTLEATIFSLFEN